MRFLNKFLAYQTNNFIILKILKKIRKIFNIYFVPTNIQKLPKDNYATSSHFDYQEEIVKKFNKTNNLVSFNTCPKIVQMLKMLFLDENLKFNLLDFGGENIDFYLYLKKKFRNINYFVHNKKEINQDFLKLKEKYKFKNITVLENINDISNNKYDFICFGSVIQYVENYEQILSIAIKTSKKYIFFSATHFFSKIINKKKRIIVRQVNFLPSEIYCYFFNFNDFLEIFTKNKFYIVFNEKNIVGNINYNNFGSSLGNISYTDLLLSQ
jgi:hypothetical protein